MGTTQSQDRSPEEPLAEAASARNAARTGLSGADPALANRIYDALRAIAHRQLRAERASHTLGTTALVHEVYLRLVDQSHVEWDDRAQFFAVAARAMRRILVDYARQHRALRRGGGRIAVSLDDPEVVAVSASGRADDLIALDAALERLERLDSRLSQVVEYRFFAGLTEAETAELLGVTPRTVARDWVKARGWLYLELRDDVT